MGTRADLLLETPHRKLHKQGRGKARGQEDAIAAPESYEGNDPGAHEENQGRAIAAAAPC